MQSIWLIILQNLPAAILLIAGLVLVGAEMFLPGFGVPGIAGLVCLVLGVVFGARSLLTALLLILCIIVILCLMLIIAMRSAARGRISRSPLVLNSSTNAEEGFSSTEDESSLVGALGMAATALRPSGIADIDGKRYDVVTEGDFVKAGERVTVAATEGRRIVVRPAGNDAPASQEPLDIQKGQG